MIAIKATTQTAYRLLQTVTWFWQNIFNREVIWNIYGEFYFY